MSDYSFFDFFLLILLVVLIGIIFYFINIKLGDFILKLVSLLKNDLGKENKDKQNK